MGLSFKSEFERNPIVNTPAQPPVDPCAELQAQLDEVNQFIDENNLLKNFYMWQEIKKQMYDTSAEVIEDDNDKLLN
jgi:hypothetical protein